MCRATSLLAAQSVELECIVISLLTLHCVVVATPSALLHVRPGFAPTCLHLLRKAAPARGARSVRCSAKVLNDPSPGPETQTSAEMPLLSEMAMSHAWILWIRRFPQGALQQVGSEVAERSPFVIAAPLQAGSHVMGEGDGDAARVAEPCGHGA